MKVLLLIVTGCLLAYATATDKFEPSVAFVCDRSSMHMHKDGSWVSDPRTDCMEGKAEILAYCKKSYPTLDITNIVESSEHKHIKGWCALGKSDCSTNEAFKVRPYRCLTGPFQSDALVVPQGCVFDHVHQTKQCQTFDWWSDVAHKACRGLKHMQTESFAMLLPCSTDMFTGVEYVCCPNGSNSTAEATTKSELKLEMPSIVVKIEPSAVAETESAELKVVDNYMHMKASAYKQSEHDAFTIAKKKLVKVEHEKVTKLMKDWAEARKRVMDLKEIDAKGAEKLNKEITPRFQKEYFAMQTSSESKTLQLDSVHQQHVQSNLDAKKRKTVEKLMEELQDDQPDPAAITKYLKRYINIEEKDAHHCINHYTKIRDRDASQGQQLLPSTINHLTLISTRVNQSIDLLDTLDSDTIKNKILTDVRLWKSKTFNSVDGYIATFSKQLAAHPVVKASVLPNLSVGEPLTIKRTPEIKKPVITLVESKPAKPTAQVGGMYKQFADKFAAKAGVAKLQKPVDVDEEEEKENEHSHKPQVNHMAKGAGLSLESNAVPAQVVTSKLSVGAGLAIAIGVTVGVLVIVFSIVFAKNRAGHQSKPSKDSYLEVCVDDNTSAEERHIASMQNGYENPTYKYLEKKN